MVKYNNMNDFNFKSSTHNPILKIESKGINSTIFLNKLALYQSKSKDVLCPKTDKIIKSEHLVLLFDSGKELSFKDEGAKLFNALEAYFNSSD